MTNNLPELPKVIEQIRKIAADNPDFVYEKGENGACTYTKNGRGSCIVGQAYLALGIPFEWVGSWDYASGGNPLSAEELIELEYSEYFLTDRKWITSVQIYQDGEVPFLEAVQKADMDTGIDTP